MKKEESESNRRRKARNPWSQERAITKDSKSVVQGKIVERRDSGIIKRRKAIPQEAQ